MSITIHHGPPGSYKSFSCVQRFAIPALVKGRTVVTNIRDFDSIESVEKAFPNLTIPAESKIIHVNSSTDEGRALLARWWHWIPFGAMVILDEAQFIYPQRMRIADLNQPPDSPIDVEQSYHGESRPVQFAQAFDMHRHFNWDLFLATPNVNKINKEIRSSSEYAYRHKNMGTLVSFLKGYWLEFQHDPETSGKSPTHFVGSPSRYKFDKRVAQCYSSTVTGEHLASAAGKPFYKQTKILMCFVLIVGASFMAIKQGSKVYDKRKDTITGTQETTKQTNKTPSSPNNLPPGRDSSPQNYQPSLVKPVIYKDTVNFSLHKLSITGYKLDDLDTLPANCKPFNHSIRCSVALVEAREYSNFFCKASTCTLVLFPQPTPKQPPLAAGIPQPFTTIAENVN